MKRYYIYALVLALALVCGCAQPAAITQPPSADTTAPAATATPTQPPATTAAPPDPTPVFATDEPDPTLLAEAIDFMPGANQLITVSVNELEADPVRRQYAYAAFGGEQDPAYALTRFAYDQPFFYTNYYLDDTGLWTEDFEGEGLGRVLILPAEMRIGDEFTMGRDPAMVVAIDASFAMGGYMAEGCLVIRTKALNYSSDDMYIVYEPGYGEIARYIIYDENVTDLISVYVSSQELSPAEVEQIISDSAF